MDKPLIDALAGRLETLERRDRRWRWAAGASALALAALLPSAGLTGPRAVVAQPPAARPAPPRMVYKTVDDFYLNQIEKPLQKLADEGWEVVQVVPTAWSGGDQGAYGNFSKGMIIARRPVALDR